MTQTYNADAVEVLTGSELVRRRRGFHRYLALTVLGEVIDNSVDMTLAGHANARS